VLCPIEEWVCFFAMIHHYNKKWERLFACGTNCGIVCRHGIHYWILFVMVFGKNRSFYLGFIVVGSWAKKLFLRGLSMNGICNVNKWIRYRC